MRVFLPEKLLLFESCLREELGPFVQEAQKSFERTLQGPVAPNGETSFNVKKFRKFSEIRNLLVISWIFEEKFFGNLLRLEIEDYLEQISKGLWEGKFYELSVLLNSKEDCLWYLYFNFSERDFFGNLLPDLKRDSQRLRFRKILPSKAKRKIRHRGYRDHGSCRPQHLWLPHEDWSFTDWQNSKEEESDRRNLIRSSLRKFGLLAVRLPWTETERGQEGSLPEFPPIC